MKVHIVQFVTYDCEGTYHSLVGVASTPERAQEMVEAQTATLLKSREANQYCKRCGFARAAHDPDSEIRKILDSKGFAGAPQRMAGRYEALRTCKFEADPPKLGADEEFEVTPMEVDDL